MKFNSNTNIWLLFLAFPISQFGFSLFLPSLPEISLKQNASISLTN